MAFLLKGRFVRLREMSVGERWHDAHHAAMEGYYENAAQGV